MRSSMNRWSQMDTTIYKKYFNTFVIANGLEKNETTFDVEQIVQLRKAVKGIQTNNVEKVLA